MNFRKFLTESIMNDDKDKLRTIIQKLISGDKQWLDKYSIEAKDKGQYWIVNYGISDKNEYNHLVRGMVIRKPTSPVSDPLQLIVSFPPTRFFNLHEPQAAPVNLANSEMIEKLDGCLTGVAFPSGDPHKPLFHTRKMISEHKPDTEFTLTSFHGKSYNLLNTIGDYVKKLPFTIQDVRMTYVFEFIHDSTFVVTRYKPAQYGLYLLFARNLDTYEELSETELDTVAQRLGVQRPRRWDAIADQEQIQSLMKQIDKDTENFEGFVFRDKNTNQRVKVKNTDYIRLHHLIDQKSFKNLVQKVLEGEEDEIISYFPDIKPKIDEIKQKFAKFTEEAVESIKHYRNMNLDRKSIALKVFSADHSSAKQAFINSMIMKHFQEPDDQKIYKAIDTVIRELALGKGKNAGSPKRFLEIIGINDDEEETGSDVGEL